ncbi:hypothetical protein ALT_9018 [Aspergillus lentulus]|uniref:Uncharacterized protein n=1 Tax=Aspergillus lentulus TaxID=293939 RepID=A0AAN4PRL0_ASPLE|nr:uncharacterized protein IFM58399_09498 [Aspergillus lentulus]KAF4152099.1 hypothetical protein CNMCM6069_002584 [Aspergillus lentulus]KAF4162334.1 hypothetical protein CNMCM6936_002272 [Aspergillus lentulus]KAF4179076.1 hypothetical protein CNMCM7927_002131 [Aspergillus lentulus]GAQ11697.1 hypothetical protein ALT_9018 [Aspergillus lentulus]GFF53147.1 hypothetical protein IFM58399_09498 [Aspergillus lentulus]
MGASLGPKSFHQVLDFSSKHWLDDAPAEFQRDNQTIYQPWSMGTRNCLGRNPARAEIRLIIANMLRHLDLELDGRCMGDGNWFDQKICGIWFKKPLWVSLSPARAKE